MTRILAHDPPARDHESSNLALGRALVGTPEYMAPEQALGKEAEIRFDIYSAAGRCSNELLTGRLPFTGGAPIEVAMKHVQAVPAPPIQAKPTVPAAIDALILNLIERWRRWPGRRHRLTDLKSDYNTG